MSCQAVFFYGTVYLHLKGSVSPEFEHQGSGKENSLLMGRNLEQDQWN